MRMFGYGPDVRVSVSDLQDEFNNMFSRFWHGGLVTGPLDGQDWAPQIDLIDEPDQFIIRAEVPGVAGGQIDVSVSGNTLAIKGSKKPAHDEGGSSKVLFAESRSGSFCREITFPSEVRSDGISAATSDGILIIRVPKADSAKPKAVRVEVKPGP